ncbi:hypothetical protein Tco_0718211 [Tanacetum coccineum]
MTTKSAGKWNFPTLTKTSSAIPDGLVVDRSASSRIIRVGVSSGSERLLPYGKSIKLMLAPRSAKAKHSTISGKSHRIRNLSGSPSFPSNFFRITAEQFSFTGVLAKSNNYSLLLRRLLNIEANFGICRRASVKLSSKCNSRKISTNFEARLSSFSWSFFLLALEG